MRTKQLFIAVMSLVAVAASRTQPAARTSFFCAGVNQYCNPITGIECCNGFCVGYKCSNTP